MIETAYFVPVVCVALAYLLGSLAFAVLVSRAMGLSDPRTFGSNNPGATNVLRSGNKTAAVATLLLDAFKGFLPVWLIASNADALGLASTASSWAAVAGLAAFLGHLYPVFFGFKGGKGVATAVGVVFGLDPLLGLSCVATFLVVAYFTRYVSWRPWWVLYLPRFIGCLVTKSCGRLRQHLPLVWWSWPCCWCGATAPTSAVY